MKHIRKLIIGLIGQTLYLAGCSSSSSSPAPQKVATATSATPTFSLITPCGADCNNDFNNDSVTLGDPTGTGTSVDPLVVTLCSQDATFGPYPALTLDAANATSFTCTSATNVDVAVTPNSSVAITATTDIGSTEAVTCTASNAGGSTAYYFDITSAGNCDACFIAGTSVLMADGTSRAIEKVEMGDQVIGLNGNVNTVIELERPLVHARTLYSFNGSPHFVNSVHPFLTLNGWKAINPEAAALENPSIMIGKLVAGDVLVLHQGKQQLLEVIEEKSGTESTPLFNLITSGDETYHVGLPNQKFAVVHS